jgi:dihydrofolate reductase
MRKIIVEAEVTLDGIVNSNEMWGDIFKYHSEDLSKHLSNLLFTPEALLMGRLTYEAFAHVWPSREGKDAAHINAMPKFVASKTLKGPLAWNAALLNKNVAQEIEKLKNQPGGDLLQYGIGELTRTMLDHGLVDEIQFLVFPFTLGKGERWFDKIDTAHFKLIETKVFSSGVVLLRYQPNPR